MKKVFRKRQKERRHLFPLGISIYRDEYFFAKLEWFLYKFFGKKRDIPCGRKKGEDRMCCCQPWIDERVYIVDSSSNETVAICKCCGKVRATSNSHFDSLKDLNEF